jgi:hypothetical protein
VKFIGIYLGRFYGLLIGGFLGARIAGMFRQADIIGFMIGALAFYFAGRWVGSKTSITIGNLLDKVFSFTKADEQEKVVEAKPLKDIFLALYIVVLPLLFVVIALLLNYYDVPIGYLVEWLPISRIIVIALSIFSIASPWLIRKRGLKFQSTAALSESTISWLGVTLSIIPAVYGFILFVAMGASIIELCLFAITSFFAAIIWSANNQMLKKQQAG